MAATRAGDDLAFERLYKRYQRRISAYVHGMVHDHGRAEDITQEVFMSAVRRMRETDRPIVFKPWIYEIAKNACIDAFRRARRAEEISYDAEDGLGGSDYGRLVSTTASPDAVVDARMSLDHLRGAFGGLSETHHDILVMRELEGLSYREIGRRLGMSRPSVESTLFRARRRLSEEYEELASGERCRSIQTLIADGAARRMGIRDERKMARHVSYCQPCRRAAYAAGFDVAALAAQKTLRAKIAAVLPVPAFLKGRWFGGSGGSDGAASRRSGGSSSLGQWSETLGQNADSLAGWAKAAALAATVAAAGVGTGVATTRGDSTLRAPEPTAPGAAAAKAAAGRTARTAGTASTAASGSSRASSSSSSSSSVRHRPASRSRSRRLAAGGSGAGGGSHGPAGPGGSSASGSSSASASGAAGGSGAAKRSASSSSGGSSAADTVKRTAGKHPLSARKVRVPKAPAPKVGVPSVRAPKSGNQTVDNVTGAATGAVDDVTAAASGAVNNATGVVNNVTSTATGAVDNAAGAATGAVDDVTSTAAGAASALVSTAADAVSNPVATATDAVKNSTGAVGGIVPGG